MHIVTQSQPLPSNATEITGWVFEPDGRGTVGILFTCLASLALSVWTAVHTNLNPAATSRKNVKIKLGVMLVATFVPEIIILKALSQLHCAKRLMRQVNTLNDTVYESEKNDNQAARCDACAQAEAEKAAAPGSGRKDSWRVPDQGRMSARSTQGDGEINRSDSHEDTNVEDFDLSQSLTAVPSREPCDLSTSTTAALVEEGAPWTLTQAYFAVMGGYIVSDPCSSGRALTLTPAGIVALAENGSLPRISDMHINDKSKADAFAKGLVCIQAGFLIFQVVARAQQSLTVTLLEIHTLMHVLCALVMYLIWFHKPYDVLSPVEVKDTRAQDLAALWALDWRVQDRRSFLRQRLDSARPSSLLPSTRPRQTCIDAAPSMSFEPSDDVADSAIRRLRSRKIHQTYYIIGPTRAFPQPRIQFPLQYLIPRMHNLIHPEILDPHPPNFADDSDLRSATANRSVFLHRATLVLINTVYGAGHMSAWNLHFPSQIEKWLWRVSAAFLVGSLGIWIVVAALWYTKARIQKSVERIQCSTTATTMAKLWETRTTDSSKLFAAWIVVNNVAKVLFLVALASHGLSRAYLLIEAFISLRTMPAGAYQTVSWLQYWPHV